MNQPSTDQPTEMQTVIQEIQNIMSAYIPDFDDRFSVNFMDVAISQVRAEKSFEINTARALVFGETGVGKTTTINYLLNSPIFPTSGELSCTKSLACGEHEGGLIFYDSPGLGDVEGLENVTRVALGIEQLEDEAIDHLTLIDITAKREEGPPEYDILPYEAYADEISASFYNEHQANIVGKQFELTAFQEWANTHFDFFVFVTSSNRGLPTPVARILRAFDQQNQNRLKLFKLFNVFGGRYQADEAALDSGIKNKYQQAQERSHKYELTDPDSWFLIDSQTGQGVDRLIQAFADTLPVEVLRSLNQVVKEQYTHLIRERIGAYFFDYTAHVASLLAVLPVDYATQGQRFLTFTIDSIITMARFMFTGHTEKTVSAKILDEIVRELEFSKRRMTYTDRVAKRKKENTLLNMVDWLGKNINPQFDAYDQFQAYEDEPVRVAQETYFTVGGIDAIHLTLALGLTIYALHHQTEAGDLSPAELETLLETSRRTVESNTGYKLRSELVRLIRDARYQETKEAKLELATELFTHVRPLISLEVSEDVRI